VIAYPHIAQQAEKLGVPLEELLDKLLSASHIEVPYERLTIVESDESDNRILEIALASRVHCVISGDKHLLQLESVRSIPIYSPARFLREYPNIL
jgi:predicted nucleic acid-binding protein